MQNTYFFYTYTVTRTNTKFVNRNFLHGQNLTYENVQNGFFTFVKENSCSTAIFRISPNPISLLFYVVNSRKHPIHIISAISCENKLRLASFSLKILINVENCLSRISFFTQIVRSEIRFIHGNFNQSVHNVEIL